MPRVPIDGPYRFFFWSRENDEPPHVHVKRDRLEAKFWIDPVVELAQNWGFARHEFLGQFGIGLLSCFLVADEIRVDTRADGAPAVRWTGYSDGRYTVKFWVRTTANTEGQKAAVVAVLNEWLSEQR